MRGRAFFDDALSQELIDLSPGFLDLDGCLQQTTPPAPTADDVPTLINGCLLSLREVQPRLYSEFGNCDPMEPAQYDANSVQLKSEGDRVLLYCPSQLYQLGEGPQISCPTDEVVSLPSEANITIWRSSHRQAKDPVVLRYIFDEILQTSTTTLQLPDEVKLIDPGKTTQSELDKLKDQMTSAIEETRNHEHRNY